MSEVILFYPKIEERKDHLLPLSVLLVAAPLVKYGYSVKIIDQRVEKNWKEILLKELRKNPLLVGISALTGRQILYGLQVSQLVKENSNALVVWGGVHPSLLPEQTLQNKFIDIVVIGEGEETLLELANKLKRKEDWSNILGIGYKRNGKIYINKRREFIDLNSQPKIPYNLIDIEKYIAKKSFASGKPGRDIALYTSRGCPHRCAFCYNKEFNKRVWRGESAERVIEHIKYLVNTYKISSFNVQDDEFFANLDRVEKICKLLLKEKISVEFISSCRIDYICRMDESFLKLIKKAGFITLEVGVESGSQRILDIIQKDIKVEQVEEAVKKLKKAGIGGKYFFMVGFPQETEKDMWLTVDLMRRIKKINPYSRIPSWRIFTPYPGCDLYYSAIDYGWKPPKSLEEWAYYDFESVKMPWIDERKERIIKNVAYMVKFLGLQDKPLSLSRRVFGKWIDFKWRNHLFYSFPEKYLIEWVKNKRLH